MRQHVGLWSWGPGLGPSFRKPPSRWFCLVSDGLRVFQPLRAGPGKPGWGHLWPYVRSQQDAAQLGACLLCPEPGAKLGGVCGGGGRGEVCHLVIYLRGRKPAAQTFVSSLLSGWPSAFAVL